MSGSADENRRLHFVLVPLLTPGHLIPMTDFALLLAQHGHPVSLVSTPANAARLRPTVDTARHSGLRINLVSLSIQTEEVGLPSGCENFDLLPTGNPGIDLVLAAQKLQQPLKEYIQSLHPTPTCLVSDFCLPWTCSVSRELSIPRYVFYSVGCFTLFCFKILPPYYESEGIEAGDPHPIIVPRIPHHIVVTRDQAPGWFIEPETNAKVRVAEDTADGIVVNTFAEMEAVYVEKYRGEMGKAVWPVGPLCLINNVPGIRGGRAAVEEKRISSWLDTQEERSVVYVCLGSISRIDVMQLAEIGLGLEATGRPFVWVIRSDEKLQEAETWLKEEGFEERTKDKGLVIRGWAPQLVILSHASVGSFVTHCGWNSVIESISAGLPMVTWPRFVDQYLNERFVLDVLGIGVAVGPKVPCNWWNYEVAEVVGREKMATAVEGVMGDGVEAEGRRRRAEELGLKARRAAGAERSSPSVKAFIEEASKAAEKHAHGGMKGPEIC